MYAVRTALLKNLLVYMRWVVFAVAVVVVDVFVVLVVA